MKTIGLHAELTDDLAVYVYSEAAIYRSASRSDIIGKLAAEFDAAEGSWDRCVVYCHSKWFDKSVLENSQQ